MVFEEVPVMKKLGPEDINIMEILIFSFYQSYKSYIKRGCRKMGKEGLNLINLTQRFH